jgi:ubiquinone biosynthesis monooxygenase Coq7
MDFKASPGRGQPGRGRLDGVIGIADRALKALLVPARAVRPLPRPHGGPGPGAGAPLTEAERREAGALMRVNHAGEVAAQALYHGQALFAREPRTREFLLGAAREEADHLAWCESRLSALGVRPSRFDPLWYAGSFAIGALAAAFGDPASLGFVAETERQVEGHLRGHLERLPHGDRESRAVLETMRQDEIEHAAQARFEGGTRLPIPVRGLMRLTARVMTRASYWI